MRVLFLKARGWFSPLHGGTHGIRAAHEDWRDVGTVSSPGGLLRSFDEVRDFLDRYVFGKEKGAAVPDQRFMVGTLKPDAVAKIGLIIDGFTENHATVRISGRSLKHADEQRHKLLAAVIGRLPEIVCADDVQILKNKNRDNSAFIVYRRSKEDGANALVVIEIAKNGTGTDIVNILSSDDRKLKQHERKSIEWLEGRPNPHPQASDETSAGGDFSDVQPSDIPTIPDPSDKSTMKKSASHRILFLRAA